MKTHAQVAGSSPVGPGFGFSALGYRERPLPTVSSERPLCSCDFSSAVGD